LRIGRATDHIHPGVQQLGDIDAQVHGRGGQRRMADVPQLEVRLGRRQ